jgi:hypothetical protein
MTNQIVFAWSFDATAPATGEDAWRGEALAQSRSDKGAAGVGECVAGGDVILTSS